MSLALLLDLGLSNVVLKAAGNSRNKAANEVLSTVLMTLIIISTLAGIGLACMMYWMLPGMEDTLVLAVVLLSIRATVASLPWTVCRSALYARGKMSATNLMQSIGILVYSAVACYSLSRGASLAQVAAISLAFTALDSGLLLALLHHYLPDIKLRPRFHFASLRPLLSLGGASLLVNIAGFILLKTDPIIVKTFLPFAEVAMYAVALRIAENVFLLCKQLVNAITPHAIRAGIAADPQQRARIFERASRYVMALGAPIYVCTLILGKSGIRLWLSKDYESSASILNILLLAMILSIPQLVGSNLLTFSGHHKKTATFITAGAFINVAASIFFVHLTGATGVAYGTLITTLFIDVTIVVPFACRSFDVNLWRFTLAIAKSIVIPCAVQAAALTLLSQHLQANSLTTVLCEGLLGCTVFAIAFFSMGVTPEERRILMRAILPSPAPLSQTAEAR
jgi:O-antigen/teichoic acid export membrane protein